MISEKKIEFLKQEGRRYIVGTPRSQLKAYQQELLEGSWEEVHEGLEVQLCPTPTPMSSDTPESIEEPTELLSFPVCGGLHHRYERIAA